MLGLHQGLLIAAVVLFGFAAIPPIPYTRSLKAIGLALLAAAHLASPS